MKHTTEDGKVNNYNIIEYVDKFYQNINIYIDFIDNNGDISINVEAK